MKSVKKWGVALVAALATSGAVAVGATSAEAVTTPAAAITSDPNASNGSLSFYDASGNVVTSGTSLTRLFDYAAASSAPARSGITKATVYFAFPNHSQSNSIDWFTPQATAASAFPVTSSSAPATIKAITTPVATASSGDANLAALLPTTDQDHTAGYDGILQVRLYDSGPGKPTESTFWASDIYYDATAKTWQQVYPEVGGPVATTTTVKASPTSTTPGKTVSLTATISSTSAAGTVQFAEGASKIGTPVTVANGTATTATGALAAGKHTFTASFTPTDATAFTASSGTTSVTVSAPRPDASALSISRSVSVAYGRTTKVTGALTDTTTRKPIGGAAVVLYLRHTTTAAWTRSSTVHSSATGAVAITVKPASRTYYQWRYAATTTHSAATSPSTTVSVAQTATIHATPARVTHGRIAKIWGGVAPSASGRKVTLQKKSGATYRTVTATTTKRQKLPNGSTTVGYVFSVKPATKGTFSYRVVVSATSTLSAGTSAAVIVKAV